jgi:hypothetical protein
MRIHEQTGMLKRVFPELDRGADLSAGAWGLVAGAYSVAIHNALSAHLSRHWPLPLNGRRLKKK